MTQAGQARTLSPASLRAFAARALAAAGVSPAGAEAVAEALVEADLAGLASHGVMHLPNLVRRIRLGLVDPRAEIRLVRDGPATALLDGGNGLGHLVAAEAMALAVTKARATGLAAVGVANGTHFGRAARYANQAAAVGLIGVAVANATPVLAAPGGAQRVLGTNPLAIAIPGPEGRPAVSLDLGMGEITYGRVRDHFNRGEPLPDGQAADSRGLTTQDPGAVLDGGFLLPFGGHRGFGLALVVEVLAGVLTGAGIGPEVGSLFVDFDRPQRTGLFFLALDPGRFLPPETFAARMAQLTGWLKNSARAPGEPPLRLPGERSLTLQAAAGPVAVDSATWTALLALAAELELAPPGQDGACASEEGPS